MDIYGIIGWPVQHSLSPAMHNAAFKELGIDAEYRKFEVKPEELEAFLLRRIDVQGFNITIPHKVKALEIIKERGELEHRQVDLNYIEFCGAINTVKRFGQKFLCANTDVTGFMRSLKEDLQFEHRDKNILLIGCGGAARAVIAGLTGGCEKVKKIYIYDNNSDVVESAKRFFYGKRISENLEFISGQEIPEVVADCQLLVNASPIGMKERDSCVIDKNLLRKDLFVYDLVYNRETELVKYAIEVEARAVGGSGMLLYQGIRTFEIWTQERAPEDIMRKALNKSIMGRIL